MIWTAPINLDHKNTMYEQSGTDKKPFLIIQYELNYLARDFSFINQRSELLVSRLQEWNLLCEDARATEFRKRSLDLQQYYSTENNLYCSNIRGVFDDLGIEYKRSHWKLLIGGSLYRNKAVLLHTGNTLPSIPICRVS